MAGKDLSKPSVDPISDILKWVLLVTAIVCFALLGWATIETYEQAPPQPQAFTDRSGNVIMSAGDIVGAVGISGDTSDKDEEAGVAGIKAAGLVPGVE